jgi:hypothetical protein
MVALDASARIVTLQFSFTNPDAIPASIRKRTVESAQEAVERKVYVTGSMIIEPTEDVTLFCFPGELEAAGYEMVDALYKQRLDPKDSRGKRMYHMVRFMFARKEHVMICDEFRAVRDEIRGDLAKIATESLWRVRGYSNPFYGKEGEVEGVRAISLNMEVRRPRFEPSGKPVVVWQKDANGDRIGDAPIPLPAKKLLRVNEGTISLV